MTQQTLARPAAASEPPTDPGHRRRRHRYGERPGLAYLFLSPWIAGALVLTIGPMLASLYLSFTDYDLFTSPQWVGLANYRRLFDDDPRFLTSVGVTLRYVLISTPLKLIAALGVAILLNRVTRGSAFYRSAFYAPSLLGASAAIAIVWRLIFDNQGIVDKGLSAVGIHTGGWVASPRYALLVIVALAVWQFGAPMVIFLAGLKQIPQELYDASAVDGASPWRTFRSVTLPMLSPVVFFNLVLEMIHAFQSFTGAFVVSGGRGGPSDTTLFYTLYLYDNAFSNFRMGYASAMAWVLLLVIAVVTAALFGTSRRWVYYAGEDAR
ncbi:MULTISPECIES: sugar ABC transporter permease [Actinoplanes]|uniref:carbohydrate ABC transporter permease n=1 Tax=Actinoplanes TaxID=1865 RepID=UPI0005F2D17C|nr:MULTISPECIES: sugar ABC transporter permease [Actinoplanes]GLY06411.1 sugar ABC transporter permease [Actinoplanes sp. NBRC 101535]